MEEESNYSVFSVSSEEEVLTQKSTQHEKQKGNISFSQNHSANSTKSQLKKNI